jgi:hypothetical protein
VPSHRATMTDSDHPICSVISFSPGRVYHPHLEEDRSVRRVLQHESFAYRRA